MSNHVYVPTNKTPELHFGQHLIMKNYVESILKKSITTINILCINQ
jgi:hypothetical protein